MATVDDDTLMSLVDDNIDMDDLSSNQKQHLRYQCIYLRKSYEIALQYMNTYTWTQCINVALVELCDQGIVNIKCDRTIREWNIRFRNNEILTVSNQRCEREPLVFAFFPEAKKKSYPFVIKRLK